MPFLDIHPFDAADRGVKNGCLVKVLSTIGEQMFIANVTNAVPVGHCFAPIHWNHSNCSDGKVCTVIPANTDPVSGQPEFKATPVEVKTVKTCLDAQIVSTTPLDTDQLRELSASFWVAQSCEGGMLYTLKFSDSEKPLTEILDVVLGEESHATVSASTTSAQRAINMKDNVVVFAAAIYPSEKALQQPDIAQLVSPQCEPNAMHGFLAGTLKAKSRTICTCKQVTQSEIEAVLDSTPSCSVQQLGELTGAGTGCGSCTSELENMIGSPKRCTEKRSDTEAACGR